VSPERAANALTGLIPKLSICDLRILMMMLAECLAQNSKAIAISTYYVSQETGISRLSVGKAMRRLADGRLIHVTANYGAQPAIYVIDIAAMEALGADHGRKSHPVFGSPDTPPARQRTRRR
jgi:hypothetical protein